MQSSADSVIHAKTIIKILAIMSLAMLGATRASSHTVSAASCPDLKVIFARGSGATRQDNEDYRVFQEAIRSKLATSGLSYKIEDLDYPAVGVGVDHLDVTLGAYIGGGESYTFGDSVKQGITNLAKVVNSSTCKDTKYVIAGYSQGAIVISGGLERLNPDKVIYAATFGDPKIYLPEGAGLIPPACQGARLSDYRAYVPDCRAYKGLLGAKMPYTEPAFHGKVGTWCNKYDIFCSSHFSISSHISYVKDNLYEDASRLIFSKIAKAFNFKNQYTSPHDTAILIDSTGSMSGLIDKYKSEALNLAEKTLSAGGRVALYDYRDLADGYQPIEYCNFETCTDIATFRAKLEEITTDGGNDEPESLLSASLHVMKSLKWHLGSTKSLVVLTDAGYHSPDHDGTTFYDVKKLSKEIDPVNFYIITEEDHLAEYRSLAEATDGEVATASDDLSILTNTILERFNSLPRVEEEFEPQNLALPHLEITSTFNLSDSEYKISFKSTGDKTVVILNDTVLGTTNQTTITVTGLRQGTKNTLTLVPLRDDLRGDPVSTDLSLGSSNQDKHAFIPKAPNTGRK